MSKKSEKVPSPDGKPCSCPECQGRGWKDNRCLTSDLAQKCMYCDGKGFDALENTCYACHGTGRIEVRQSDKNPCPLCGGAGVYPVPESMKFTEFAYHPMLKKR